MNPKSRLLAIDPSLTCSGWALFSVSSGKLCGVGKIRSESPSIALAERLLKLQNSVTELIETLKLGGQDYLICEAPTTMRDPRAALKVEQVRSIFECSARARAVQVPGRISPRSVHFEIMGLRGKQLPRIAIKECAVHTALALFGAELSALGFPTQLKSMKQQQDIIDALLIGCVGIERVKAAEIQNVSLAEFLDKDRQKRLGDKGLKALARKYSAKRLPDTAKCSS